MSVLLSIIYIILALAVEVLQLPLYTVELKDLQSFEIASDDNDENDEDESEMLQLGNVFGLDRIVEDNNRYEALHSHVKHHNRRATEQKTQLADFVPYVEPRNKEVFIHEQEDESFIAGFKRQLDNMDKTKNTVFKTTPNAYEYEIEQYSTDAYQKSTTMSNAIAIHNAISNEETTEYMESPDEEYDYEKLKMEYDSRIADIVKRNETLNYTNIGATEDTPEQVLKNVLDTKHLKNCTSEELEQFGVGAIKCLIYDHQHLKNAANRKKILAKAWIAFRFWLFIYFCIAIPCWCHKGWCCCCCRCKYCFPRKRIELAKRYYVVNPPGILVKDWIGAGTQTPIEYKSDEFETDAYERLEAAIRNL